MTDLDAGDRPGGRPRRVVVTGGSGFMGLNFVEQLLAIGDEVVIFDLAPPPDRAWQHFASLPGRLSFTQGDIQDPDSLDGCFDPTVNAVLHAAAITADAGREIAMPGRIVGVNITGTANVATIAAARKVPRVVLVSSAAIYGEGQERYEDGPARPRTLYAVTKHAAEGVMARLADLGGFQLIIARLGWMYGPWEHASGARDTLSAIFQMTMAALAGQSVRIPRPDCRDWMYAPDAAAAVVQLLGAERPSHRVYNIAPEQSWDLSEWADRLQRRFPGFRCGLDGGTDLRLIELHSTADLPPLPGARFSAEFGSPLRFTPDDAFADYMNWLEREPWPAATVKAEEPKHVT